MTSMVDAGAPVLQMEWIGRVICFKFHCIDFLKIRLSEKSCLQVLQYALEFFLGYQGIFALIFVIY
jgi:hypothetical protein